MKSIKLFTFCATISLATIFSGCRPVDDTAAREAEIQRRVEERMREERLADLEQRLNSKELDLSDKAALIAERERLIEEQKAAAEDARRAAERASREASAPSAKRTDYASGGPGGDYEGEDLRASARYPSTSGARHASYDTFYDDLDPHGDWIETSSYGYVFRPNVVHRNRSWRPYVDGRWVYSDYGWTWVSDEPFGWATYHYGRWVQLERRGWCWVPGDEWAPAWVSWRYSDDYVGWAPLPPEARFEPRRGITVSVDFTYDIGPSHYNFCPVRSFGADRLDGYILAPERNVTIIRNTRNVTNITYKNKVVINEGPSFERISERSGQKIERVKVKKVKGEGRDQRVRLSGDTLEIAAPDLDQPSGEGRGKPKEFEERVEREEVDRGWDQMKNPEERKALKKEMQREAIAVGATATEAGAGLREARERRDLESREQQDKQVEKSAEKAEQAAEDAAKQQRKAEEEARRIQEDESRKSAKEAEQAAEEARKQRENTLRAEEKAREEELKEQFKAQKNKDTQERGDVESGGTKDQTRGQRRDVIAEPRELPEAVTPEEQPADRKDAEDRDREARKQQQKLAEEQNKAAQRAEEEQRRQAEQQDKQRRQQEEQIRKQQRNEEEMQRQSFQKEQQKAERREAQQREQEQMRKQQQAQEDASRERQKAQKNAARQQQEAAEQRAEQMRNQQQQQEKQQRKMQEELQRQQEKMQEELRKQQERAVEQQQAYEQPQDSGQQSEGKTKKKKDKGED